MPAGAQSYASNWSAPSRYACQTVVCPLTFVIVTIHVHGTTTDATRCGADSAFVDKISQGHDLVSSPQGIGNRALGLRALGIRS